jgi:23S rRNA (pseudouridine1915-N3)-methyltransferase
MIKIKILSVGKTREQWLEEALAEYFKRLQKTVQFECLWAKDDTQLLALAEKEDVIICLDPAGKLMTSEKFAIFFSRQVEAAGARLAFVIGGPEGLPMPLKQHSKIAMFSLSPMTFTHQLTRLILVEQIYRAMEILKGSKYHKGNA